MRFHVTAGSELPIFRQIVRQVVDAVAGGKLKPGDKLPSHRALAAELVVAPLTVKRAYDELERQGHIHTLRGQGTFITDASPSQQVTVKKSVYGCRGRWRIYVVRGPCWDSGSRMLSIWYEQFTQVATPGKSKAKGRRK